MYICKELSIFSWVTQTYMCKVTVNMNICIYSTFNIKFMIRSYLLKLTTQFTTIFICFKNWPWLSLRINGFNLELKFTRIWCERIYRIETFCRYTPWGFWTKCTVRSASKILWAIPNWQSSLVLTCSVGPATSATRIAWETQWRNSPTGAVRPTPIRTTPYRQIWRQSSTARLFKLADR